MDSLINNNGLDLNTLLNNISKSIDQLSNVTEKLSSGDRIASASDDAAGLALSTSLERNSKLYSSAILNINDGISMANIMYDALEAQSEVLEEMNELATYASDINTSADQRTIYNNEYQALKTEYSRISNVAEYNGYYLLKTSNTSSSPSVQVGIKASAANKITVELSNTSESGGASAISGTSVSSQSNAETALSAVETAQDFVGVVQGKINAALGRFEYTLQNIQSTKNTIDAANAKITEIDAATELSRYLKLSMELVRETSILASVYQDSISDQTPLSDD